MAEYKGASLCLEAEPEVSMLCLRGFRAAGHKKITPPAVRRKRVELEAFVQT